MGWTIEFSASARKSLKKLDRQAACEILDYLDERIAGSEDPRRFGKALVGPLAGLWRYRVRDFRIICSIEDGRLIVLVLDIGHRSEVYR
ncbi:mRNA interferase RelE/StbE [Devosia enhydra]|uniref:mRNA interferase RelE/StbE n=1 Tax=Devosia enhydra TaxID=665118 RepID=A0A1K2HYR3_9HYPH|nr:type II toxin-antitoxin system RelE/ParE family toxin [Devosia enhydra]SFZ85171.1 mRNA interferase RelE/StbE [Devosia enhydra]